MQRNYGESANGKKDGENGYEEESEGNDDYRGLEGSQGIDMCQDMPRIIAALIQPRMIAEGPQSASSASGSQLPQSLPQSLPPPPLPSSTSSSSSPITSYSTHPTLPLSSHQLDHQNNQFRMESISRNLIVFCRLTVFRGSPSYSSGLEYLSVDEVTWAGLVKDSLSVDVVVGRVLMGVLRSDHNVIGNGDKVEIDQNNDDNNAHRDDNNGVHEVLNDGGKGEKGIRGNKEELSLTKGDEREFSSDHDSFISSLRRGLVRSLIATVAGKNNWCD